MAVRVVLIDDPGSRLREALGESAFTALLGTIAEQVRQKWQDAAAAQLTATRTEYVRAIGIPKQDGPNAVFIELRGRFANMIEHGSGPYWLQDVLLKGGAKFRVIPFRFTGADARGTLAPTLGSAYGADTWRSRRAAHHEVPNPKVLGRRIQRAMKAAGGAPLREGLVPKLREHHSTDLYAGLQRTGDPGHGQYRTFRTITAASRGTKWLHPGIMPRHFMDSASAHLRKIVPAVMKAYLNEALR